MERVREIFKGDKIIVNRHDLKNYEIVSKRHFDCTLVVEVGVNDLGIFHNPASDYNGTSITKAFEEIAAKAGTISTSIVIFRSDRSYQQAKMIHRVERMTGIHPQLVADIDIAQLVKPGIPVDIIVCQNGIHLTDGNKEQSLFTFK